MDIGWSVSLAASFLVYRLFEAFDVVDLILVGLEQWRLKVENATESAMVCERLQGSFVRLKWTSPLAKHFYKAELNQTLYFSISAVSVFLFHKLLSLVKTNLASSPIANSAASSSYNSSLWFIIALVILSVRLSQLLMHSTKQARELFVCLLVGLVSFLVSASILILGEDKAWGSIVNFGVRELQQKRRREGSESELWTRLADMVLKWSPFLVSVLAGLYSTLLTFSFTRLAKIHNDLFTSSSLSSRFMRETGKVRSGRAVKISLKLLQSISLFLIAYALPSFRDNLPFSISLESWSLLTLCLPALVNLVSCRLYMQVYLDSAYFLSKEAATAINDNICLVFFQLICPFLFILFHALLILDTYGNGGGLDGLGPESGANEYLQAFLSHYGSPYFFYLTWWSLCINHFITRFLSTMYSATTNIGENDGDTTTKKDQ